MREKNRMSRAAAGSLAANEQYSPREWEKKVAAALRVNGWTFWHDKDRPTKHAKTNKLRVPGLPDFLIHKTFERLEDVPDALANLCFGTGGSVGIMSLAALVPRCPLSICGFVECKTGRGVTTAKQEEWLQAARDCPGMFALVAYPANFDVLTEVIGGVYST